MNWDAFLSGLGGAAIAIVAAGTLAAAQPWVRFLWDVGQKRREWLEAKQKAQNAKQEAERALRDAETFARSLLEEELNTFRAIAEREIAEANARAEREITAANARADLEIEAMAKNVEGLNSAAERRHQIELREQRIQVAVSKYCDNVYKGFTSGLHGAKVAGAANLRDNEEWREFAIRCANACENNGPLSHLMWALDVGPKTVYDAFIWDQRDPNPKNFADVVRQFKPSESVQM